MQDLSVLDRRGAREAILVLALAVVPISLELATTPEPAMAAGVALLARGTSGVLFLVAGLLFYLVWRISQSPRKAWLVAAVVLLACQLMGSAVLGALSHLDAHHREHGWPLVVDFAVTGVVVAMAAVALEDSPPRLPDPLAVGLALGVAGTVVKPVLYALDLRMPVEPTILVAAIAGAYGVLAAAILLRRAMPTWLAWRLAGTLLLLSGAHAAASPRFPGLSLDLLSGMLLVLAGALWTGTCYAALRHSLDHEHLRAVQLESSLLEMEGADRGNREALHELKATIAGLAKASELLGDVGLSEEVKKRLQRSLISELARLERRLWLPTVTDQAVVDLDVTLDTVLDLHRARGRVFAWTPTGASVVGRPDAIAEAVNILLDNAATHGDAGTGRVEVGPDEADADMIRIAVSDEGPGVPADMRQHIFEWGGRCSTSTGQGIGLHVARRLVSDLGGSLTLGEASSGSSFVIRLPAARRSEEVIDALAEQPAL